MEIQCITSSFPLHAKSCRIFTMNNSWPRCHHQRILICFNSRIHFKGEKQSCSWKISARKRKKCVVKLIDDPPVAKASKKKGTVAGAVALIIGTSIGSGILALPKTTSPAGIVPSSISMTICWGFLLIEALILAEINVELLRKKKKMRAEENNELEIISIRTMAQETLGEWGGVVATVTYVFFCYTTTIAYISKSGEILYHLINLPESVSSFFFVTLFSILISVGGTQVTDQVNQWLTATMIGLLVAIEVLAIVCGGWSGFGGNGHWEKVPATLPGIIFSLVYHDLSPVLCAYLGGDLTRIRTSLLLGSFVPLLVLLMWDAIALGLSAQVDQVIDPVELLTSVRWSGVSFMVEAFSLLAVGTSLIGTLLGFSEFFKEQVNLFLTLPSAGLHEKSNLLSGSRNWWERHRVSFTATTLVIAPSLFVSTTVPDAFYAATDIAGGYCMTMLYGVLPPAMAWAAYNRKDDNRDETAISRARPALVGVGLFACAIVMVQILQDLSKLYS